MYRSLSASQQILCEEPVPRGHFVLIGVRFRHVAGSNIGDPPTSGPAQLFEAGGKTLSEPELATAAAERENRELDRRIGCQAATLVSVWCGGRVGERVSGWAGC